MMRMIADVDVRAVLPTIAVPTLVVHRVDDVVMPAAPRVLVPSSTQCNDWVSACALGSTPASASSSATRSGGSPCKGLSEEWRLFSVSRL